MYNVWLHRYTAVVAVCTLFLVVAGGLVTSNDAGLSVPDWPLSYGKLMPKMEGNIFYEHGHRLIAALVAMLTTALAVFLWRKDSRRWVRILGVIAVLAVLALAFIAILGTALGVGAFASEDPRIGMTALWSYLASSVGVTLLIVT